MRHHVIPHSLSIKIAAALDVIGTLAIEHVGYTYKLPVWHPAILATVLGMTYALFRWKDEISHAVIKVTYGIKDMSAHHTVNIIDSTLNTATTVPLDFMQRGSDKFDAIRETMTLNRVKSDAYKNRNRSFAPN